MAGLDRRRFLGAASLAGVAVAATPGTATAHGGAPRVPNVVGVAADNGATVIAQNVVDARTLDVTIDSTALGHTASARVILPMRYGRLPRASWPVLYLLHGGFGNYTDWARNSAVAELSRTRDVLVVMPDGGKLGFYTDWWAHGGSKPGWETFHLTELTQILERGLRAGDRRAIAGLSMGGFGAVSYAARRPGFFRAAASFSGTLDTLHPSIEPVATGTFAAWLLGVHYAPSGYDPLALFGDPTAQRDVWAAHNPADLVADLRGTKLHVSCGNGQVGPLDPPGTDPGGVAVRYEAAQARQNREFFRRARRQGLDIAFDIYPGSHSWPLLGARTGEGVPDADARARLSTAARNPGCGRGVRRRDARRPPPVQRVPAVSRTALTSATRAPGPVTPMNAPGGRHPTCRGGARTQGTRRCPPLLPKASAGRQRWSGSARREVETDQA